MLLSSELESGYATGCPSLEWLKTLYPAEVYSGAVLQNLGDLLLRIYNFPAIEVSRLLIESGKDSSEQLCRFGNIRLAICRRRRQDPRLGVRVVRERHREL